ncbi:hypothetical protein HEB94_000568 [Actinopolymorpha pittospori]|uniref:Uncharacterized protein n=1 Tax=Actinopolymorpha pittospori TaxID=648752 RepID=A0A927R981_9ACTN|nr:hypothetical protein [Actinopolymorpha pittospori]
MNGELSDGLPQRDPGYFAEAAMNATRLSVAKLEARSRTVLTREEKVELVREINVEVARLKPKVARGQAAAQLRRRLRALKAAIQPSRPPARRRQSIQPAPEDFSTALRRAVATGPATLGYTRVDPAGHLTRRSSRIAGPRDRSTRDRSAHSDDTRASLADTRVPKALEQTPVDREGERTGTKLRTSRKKRAVPSGGRPGRTRIPRERCSCGRKAWDKESLCAECLLQRGWCQCSACGTVFRPSATGQLSKRCQQCRKTGRRSNGSTSVYTVSGGGYPRWAGVGNPNWYQGASPSVAASGEARFRAI